MLLRAIGTAAPEWFPDIAATMPPENLGIVAHLPRSAVQQTSTVLFNGQSWPVHTKTTVNGVWAAARVTTADVTTGKPDPVRGEIEPADRITYEIRKDPLSLSRIY